MSRTRSEGTSKSSRTFTSEQHLDQPARWARTNDLGRVNLREMRQLHKATGVDVARGVYLGPPAHKALFEEAARRLARLRGVLSQVTYESLCTTLQKLQKELGQRVKYFARKGRYNVRAVPAT